VVAELIETTNRRLGVPADTCLRGLAEGCSTFPPHNYRGL